VLAVPVGSDKITVAGNVAYAAGGDNGLLVLRLLQDKVSGIVETTGGSVASSSGNITIVFPAGAFTQPAVVTYRHLWSDQDTGDLVGIDRTFTVDAVDPAVGQPAQLAPGQTLTISVRYSDADRGPTIEETLALYAWDGQQWEREPTSVVDTTADTVTAAPTRLAHLWAVLGRTERLFLPYLEIAEP
jgi:hypothetical protein